MIFVIGVILVVFLLFKWLNAKNDYFEKRGIPYTPSSVVQMAYDMAMNKKPLTEWIQAWYNELKDEKISGMFQFMKPIFFIRDPKLLKKLAVKEFDHFPDHTNIFDEKIDKMFGKSLVILTGDKWRDMRSTLSPMFTGSKMRMMYNYVAEIGQQTTTTMKDQINAGSDNVFEFKALASKFTVDVIASCAFGIEVNSFKEPENSFAKIAAIVTDFSNWKMGLKLLGYLTMKPVMKFFKVRLFPKEVDEFFQEAVIGTMTVREEKNIVRNDMINLLMQVRKGKLEHETNDEKITEGFATVEESRVGKAQVKRVWDDEDLAAQCFLFFVGGFDTISTAMSFMAHEITVNPDVQSKLFEEIEAMESELNGKTISYDQIQGLKYMDQVVCETLRMWPPTPMVDRICVKDYQLELDNGKKITIEKGIAFSIPIYAYHRDPKFFPNPNKFDPDRFSDENKSEIDPDTYLPFGIGPRNCIGSRFALMKLKTIFYYLLKSFSFEVTAKTQIPIQIDKNPVALKSGKGVWVGLKPRQ